MPKLRELTVEITTWLLSSRWLDIEATIFVVDSSDNGSICEACEEIVDLLKIPELQGIALLIFANKQDTEDCMSAGEITSGLKLQNIKDREVSARFQC
ncbi:hypothetical protein Y032_0252g236 [Ancylostoma ceylanicum]|uniref:ADP-ribosylation factor family protein n=1 Tax=Ancylostoma ceylanicum TaxID=53326 RepID=A0A016SCP5_9BILA|nr:hypothetical protein Y032_0252g236 [Ancylostoma ceylanicum]